MSENSFEIISESTEQTIELGKSIGVLLKGGEIFSLIGNLGTGKTHLIKGIAAGAGAPDMEHVNSPTFVIINEYSGPGARLDIFHLDAYRLDSIAEFEALGFDDLCCPKSVVLIEWADKVLPALKDVDAITIELSHVSETQRKFIFKNLPIYLSDLDQ